MEPCPGDGFHPPSTSSLSLTFCRSWGTPGVHHPRLGKVVLCHQFLGWHGVPGACPPSCCASVSPSHPSSLRATAGGQWSGGYRGVCSAPQIRSGHPREPWPGLFTQRVDAPNPSWSLQSHGQVGKGQTPLFPNSLWLLFAAPHPERCHHPNFSQIWLSPWVLHERGTGQTRPQPKPQKLLEPLAAPLRGWKPPPEPGPRCPHLGGSFGVQT